jgi:neurofibromin 1
MEPHFSKPFELLFDTSEFCASRALSLHWITQFFQLVFSELNDYLVSLHIYNPNSSFQRYVRKLPRTIINKLVKRTHFSTNLSELIEHISSSEIRLPKETSKIGGKLQNQTCH